VPSWANLEASEIEEDLVAGSMICVVEGLRSVKSAAALGVSAQLGPRVTLVAGGRRLS
jgi:hypothetical protein